MRFGYYLLTYPESIGHIGCSGSGNWAAVAEKLFLHQRFGGIVNISTETSGMYKLLEARANSKYFVLNYGEYGEFEDEVLTFEDPNRSTNMGGSIEILGDVWSESLVATDFSYVAEAFKEFWVTGAVSLEHFS